MITMARIYNASFMNLSQLLKSMLYRINNDIGWREIRFYAIDKVFGGVRCWSLRELAATLEDDGFTLSQFLSCYGLIELGFIFVRRF